MRQLLLAALALACASAWAQTYRWVDPATGRSVISDTPPPANAKGLTKVKDVPPTGGIESFTAKRAAENFPVTLYTAPECTNACNQARVLLKGRGVAFEEKIVQRPEDAEELKKLTGDLAVPVLKVGKQTMRGFETDAYNNLLDLAGYPVSPPIGNRKFSGGPAK